MRRLLLLAGLLALLVGCGETAANLRAQVASHPAGIGVGEQRVLIALINIDTNDFVGSPEIPVTATLRDRIGSPIADFPGEFVWMIPDVRGLYVFTIDIPGPGEFQITMDAGSLGRNIGPISLTGNANPPVVQIGEAAPRSVTRTIPQFDLRDITSDPEPDPRFYQMTVAQAVEAGPSVIVFGTPAWCTSQTCGPMLEQVRGLSDEYPDLNFVHVEIYENIHVAVFEDLVFVPSVAEWGLVSEPIIFVTDRDGLVSAVFEGAVSDRELRTAFDEARG